MTTLAEIVNSALSSSEGSLKLASARDVVLPDTSFDFLEAELKLAEDEEKEDEEKEEGKAPPFKKKKEEEKKASLSSVVDDAVYAQKLAEALTLGAGVVVKLANSPVDAPGPAVMESGMLTTQTIAPKATSTVTDKITGPTTGPGGLPTTKADFTSLNDESGAAKNHPGKTAAWTTSREASLRVMRSKMAQAEVLMSMGQTKAAEDLLTSVREAQSKLAQDPSSPQPTLPAHGEVKRLDTEPGSATHIPDNSGLISLTKAQAKDSTTREVSQFISEPPKKDPAVGAHTLSTDGQKLSALISKRAQRKG